jgi:hypothetical protein
MQLCLAGTLHSARGVVTSACLPIKLVVSTQEPLFAYCLLFFSYRIIPALLLQSDSFLQKCDRYKVYKIMLVFHVAYEVNAKSSHVNTVLAE